MKTTAEIVRGLTRFEALENLWFIQANRWNMVLEFRASEEVVSQEFGVAVRVKELIVPGGRLRTGGVLALRRGGRGGHVDLLDFGLDLVTEFHSIPRMWNSSAVSWANLAARPVGNLERSP
jgi:hypothetical protein